MSENFWNTVDDAIELGFKNLDPTDDDYLYKLQALTNAVGKINEAAKNANDEARLEQTEELATKRNRIEIFKIIGSIFGAATAAGVGIWQFIKTMEFETGGGFFKSSSGKLFSKEKRKEREKETYKL